MDESFILKHGSDRLNQLNYALVKKLTDAMYPNWRLIVGNIPGLPLSQLEIEAIFGSHQSHGKNPVESIIGALGRRGVTLNDLIKSFELLKFEDGLQILGYPRQQVQSIPLFQEVINVANGGRIELYCQSIGFPYPKHIYFKNNVQIFIGNPLIIENAKYNQNL